MKYKKSFAFVLFIFSLILFHDPLLKYTVYSIFKWQAKSLKGGELTYKDIRFANGRLILHDATYIIDGKEYFRIEVKVPHVEFVLGYNIPKRKFDFELMFYDPVLKWHKKRALDFLDEDHWVLKNWICFH